MTFSFHPAHVHRRTVWLTRSRFPVAALCSLYLIAERLLRGVYAYGFEKPSVIQQKSIVPASAGRDVVM